MSGNASLGKLNQEKSQQFLELINNLELEDVTVREMSFKLLSPLEEGAITIKIGEKDDLPSLEGQKLEVYRTFTVIVEQGKAQKLRFQAQYLLLFSVANRDIVSRALEDEVILEFFLKRQIVRLVWPFLREDFHLACSKLGIHPITLKLLR